MHLSIAATLLAVFGLSSTVYANAALATITPCPNCPKSISPAPITVTSQFQPVSTCTPQKTCTKTTCHLEPSCSTYDWVSTTVPCLGGATSTLITKTDQIVELSHVSTVLTSYAPCATKAPSWNGTIPRYQNETCTSTTYQTMIVDISAPYDECGPLALGNWGGSGLCKECVPNADTKSQVVHVSKCLDGQCSTYAETWVSKKPTATASSESKAPFSSSYSCSKGINTIPVTATFSPSGDSAYTAPVTSTFAITTSVASPQVVNVQTTVTVTFTAGPAAPQETSSSLCPTPIATSTFCSTNGLHTIPITKTFTPTGGVYTEPVTTTVHYTTSVTDAPKTIECLTTVTLTFTTTYCPPQTVVSGSTLKPTAPATTYAGSVTQGGASTTPTGSAGNSQGGGQSQGSGPVYTTSTIYTTQVSTIISCAKTVTNCPAHSTSFTTLTIPVSTTVCPVSETTPTSTGPASVSASSTSGKPSGVASTTTGGSTGPTSGSSTLATSTSAGVSTTSTSTSHSHPTAPPTVGTCDFLGCFGSKDGFAGFSLMESSAKMTIDICTSECLASGFPYSGLHDAECYCAATLDDNCGADKANGVCDIACPGNSLESCGGNGLSSKRLSRSIPMLLDVYECPLPTTTTSSSTGTSTTTSGAPDKSSDPDEAPEKRSIQADMEVSMSKSRALKLRRGGMLRSPMQPAASRPLAKRDFGLKQPFGI